jgi:hypothetical protein
MQPVILRNSPITFLLSQRLPCIPRWPAPGQLREAGMFKHRRSITGVRGMKNFETLEGDFVVGRRCPLIHTALGPGISTWKPEIALTHIPVGSSTFRFHVPFAIVFWQTVSPSSSGGLGTQIRSLFGSAAMRTSSMPSG